MGSDKVDAGTDAATVQHIRQLRRTADFLGGNADWHRRRLIERVGPKQYICDILGRAAHRPASGCLFLWATDAEFVGDVGAKLWEHLCARVEMEQELPRAVVADNGSKYYL